MKNKDTMVLQALEIWLDEQIISCQLCHAGFDDYILQAYFLGKIGALLDAKLTIGTLEQIKLETK